MKNQQFAKPWEGFPIYPGPAAGTFFRIAWRNGAETGEETEVYKSCISAVQIAKFLQVAADDRPLNIQYSVVRKTGNQSVTVYRCKE